MYADNIIEVKMEGKYGTQASRRRKITNQDIVPKLTVAPSLSVPSMLPLYAHYDE